jgi:phosphate-selective porin
MRDKSGDTRLTSFTHCRLGSCAALAAAAVFPILTSVPVFGQTEPAPPNPSPSPPSYFFPDLPPNATTYDNKAFSIRVGFAILVDYTFVGQDSASVEQVGEQPSKADLRAGRLVLSGQFKFRRPWTYVIGADYNEFRKTDEDQVFEGLDVHLTIPLWKEARVVIGKQKEPFVYEMVGDAANLPQQERLLSPFFVSRNVGARYLDNYLNDRMSFSVGIYNDWIENEASFDETGTQLAGRLTGLPVWSADGRTFLHLGGAFRSGGTVGGELRYKGRPESNITDNYVDTGTFPGKQGRHLGLEALYNTGPFSVLVEYANASTESPDTGDPRFSGWYVTGSYVLTGETRPYDKKVGYARRVIPKSRWGAVELVGRFGYVDLDDVLLEGGQLAKWYAGVNWWASRQWKVGVGYGTADLDRLHTTGRTQLLLARLQWIY